MNPCHVMINRFKKMLKGWVTLAEMITFVLMKSGITEERLQEIKEEKEAWTAIIAKWDNLGPYDSIPSFTKEYAGKMIRKLYDEVDSLR